MKRALSLLAGLQLSMVCFSLPSVSEAYAQDYAGKTVTIMVGGVGGGYDIYSRFLAPYYGKHLPGSPQVVVKNMPGAGTLQVANYIYSVAQKDGLTIGAIDGSNAVGHLLKSQGVQFDPRNFVWIGNMNAEVAVIIGWKGSKIKKFEQVFSTDMIVGTAGPTSGSTVFANVLNNLIGTRFKLVTGYPGTNEMLLAMERGEIEGIPSVNLSSLVGARPSWIVDGSASILLQIGNERHPTLQSVPLVHDFAKNDEQRQIMKLIFMAPELGRPFVAPPLLPKDIAESHRTAFQKAMDDDELKQEAFRRNIELFSPSKGEDINKRIDELYKIPTNIIEKASFITGVSTSDRSK
jgi:tripartite-type tricarboxylate transporter receptor subunit TctC